MVEIPKIYPYLFTPEKQMISLARHKCSNLERELGGENIFI